MLAVAPGVGGHTGDGPEDCGGTGRVPGSGEGVGQEVEVGEGRRVPQLSRRGPLLQGPVQDAGWLRSAPQAVRHQSMDSFLDRVAW